jgi:hypothetical protein
VVHPFALSGGDKLGPIFKWSHFAVVSAPFIVFQKVESLKRTKDTDVLWIFFAGAHTAAGVQADDPSTVSSDIQLEA